MPTKQELYWADREQKFLMENILDQKDMDRLIKETNIKALNDCQDALYAWYGKYADATGMTMAEAKKAAQTADIDALAKKAKEYVKNKDFSPEANAEMKLYNFSMKTSRAELLANQLKWRMFEMTDQQERILEKTLPAQVMKELWKQSGILGKTLYTDDEMKKLADYITHTSYKGNTFSTNLWGYEQDMKTELDRLIRQSMTMGRNPAQFATQFARLFGRQQHEAERLIRTEAARVRAHARNDSFNKAGYRYLKWVPRGNPCERCLEKVMASEREPFPIEGAAARGDLPPLHPHCYCSTAPVERDEDILSKDAIDANFEKEWQKALDGDPEARAHFENLYQKTLKPDWKQLKLDDGKAVNKHTKDEPLVSRKSPKGKSVEYIRAKTKEEATEISKKYADRVDLKNLSVDMINQINETLEKNFSDKIPKLGSVEVVSGKTKFGKKVFPGGGLAAYDPYYNRMFVNSDVMKNSKAFDSYIKEANEAEEFIKNLSEQQIKNLTPAQKSFYDDYVKIGKGNVDAHSVEGLITHEYGHHIDFTTLRKIDKTMSYYDDFENKAMKLSVYAKTKKTEYVAESYTAYFNGDRENISDDLLKMFDELAGD